MNKQRIGYIRVSTFDQNQERQLEGVQVEHTFTDKASSKDIKRPQLEALMSSPVLVTPWLCIVWIAWHAILKICAASHKC